MARVAELAKITVIVAVSKALCLMMLPAKFLMCRDALLIDFRRLSIGHLSSYRANYSSGVCSTTLRIKSFLEVTCFKYNATKRIKLRRLTFSRGFTIAFVVTLKLLSVIQLDIIEGKSLLHVIQIHAVSGRAPVLLFLHLDFLFL